MSVAHGAQPPQADITEIAPGTEAVIRGRIEVRTVADVRLGLHRIIDTGHGDLVLHLADAEIADATGLGVIVGAHHRARRQGRRLVIADASERLERLIRATRLHRVLARPDAPVPAASAPELIA